MPGRRAARGARDYGLERTNNEMAQTSWPTVNAVNQKNYYTEYLKRDEQILALRLQNEANRERMVRAARDKDRALAQSARQGDTPAEGDGFQDAQNQDQDEMQTESESAESKTIIIHPGSQSIRIGLATDVLPKTVPMVIARKSQQSESEIAGGEPRPKRRKLEDGSTPDQGKVFDSEFVDEFTAMTADLKARLKRKAVRSVPNAREQAVIYNKRTPYEEVSVHNDPGQIEWTEIPTDINAAPDYIAGKAALRIPDSSNPRYRLFWPLRHGVFNENDYSNENQLLRDFFIIIEDAIKTELGLKRRSEWAQYNCVFVVPDLYERPYVTRMLDLLFRDFGFGRICFIQESLAASFGAGYSTCCVVDIGAQKTSICCVEDGLCIEDSRVNLRYGSEDVTEVFVKMMLLDSFPYADINLKRRYDFLLAEELKQKCCTMYLASLDKGTQQQEFTLRASGQDTRLYRFKTFDEVILAPMGFFYPTIFDHTDKLAGRRTLIGRSFDIYDGVPNDPVSAAQSTMLRLNVENTDTAPVVKDGLPIPDGNAAPSPLPTKKAIDNVENAENAAGASAAATPGQEDDEGAQVARATSPGGAEKEAAKKEEQSVAELISIAETQDRTLPVLPLVQAINMSIEYGSGEDAGKERKQRDFYGGVLCTGGGVLTPNFYQFLEEELLASQPRFKKEIIVGPPPRDIDPQVLVWKGASVFGKLHSSNDTWISRVEYNLLNSRIMTYKCLWQW